MARQVNCGNCGRTGNGGLEYYCFQGGQHTEYEPFSRMVTNYDGSTTWVTEQRVVQRYCRGCAYRYRSCDYCRGSGKVWIS